jgi:hypothetical protein
MKFIIISLLLIISTSSSAQYYSIINLDSISVSSITTNTKAEEIIDILGQPDSIFNPLYECGDFSEENIDTVIILRYKGIDFLNSDGLTYFYNLDFKNIKFDVKLNHLHLTNQTNIKELKDLFPQSYTRCLEEGSGTIRLWICNECDGQIQLYFENDKLISLNYWSPC